MQSEALPLSPTQERTLAIPEEFDIFLGGGRGGGKSFTFAVDFIRHAEIYGIKARALYVRKTYKGLADFEAMTIELFGEVYGKAARYNSTDHVWRLPNGAYLELGQLESAKDYGKYQGRTFNRLYVDEAGQYSDPSLLDRLKSNLRGPKGMPIRTIMAANPGDPGHHWLASRYVFKAAPWGPFLEEKSGRRWVYVPTTFVDNPFIDQDEYRGQLEASCPSDPELLRAWLEGDWTIARGAFFGGVIDEARNAIDPWPTSWEHKRTEWRLYLAHDFGTAAPSVTFVCAESPGAEGPDGKFYPKDSVVLLDELATSDPNNLNEGLRWTVPRLAEEIKVMCERWSMRPEGVADDACFAHHGHEAGSIANEFSRFGVHFSEAKKADRRTGWEVMRRMLQAAGQVDVPGLYIARSCSYFWQTVPYLGRDPRNAEDLDSRAPDHGADCARYALQHQRHSVGTVRMDELGLW